MFIFLQGLCETAARSLAHFRGLTPCRAGSSKENRLLLGVRHGCAAAAISLLVLVQRPPLRVQDTSHGNGRAPGHKRVSALSLFVKYAIIAKNLSCVAAKETILRTRMWWSCAALAAEATQT
jgi:hypothetical protein